MGLNMAKIPDWVDSAIAYLVELCMGPNMARLLGWIGSAIAYLFSFVFAIRLVLWPMFVGYWFWGQALDSIIFSPSWIPLHLIGSALLFLSLHRLSDYYNDDDIRHNSFWWFIWWVIFGEAMNGMTMFSLRIPIDAPPVVLLFIVILSTIVMMFLAISAIYLKNAYAALAAKAGTRLFNIAAKLYLFGSLPTVLWVYLPIAAFVGALLVWISWAISSLAFISIRPKARKRRFLK